jgi:hypothetical protein
VTAHGLAHRHSGGSGKADTWKIADVASKVFAALPRDVLDVEGPRDVAPPQGGGDLWGTPEADLPRNPPRGTQPRHQAENGAGEWLARDGVWRPLTTDPPTLPSEIVDTRPAA